MTSRLSPSAIVTAAALVAIPAIGAASCNAGTNTPTTSSTSTSSSGSGGPGGGGQGGATASSSNGSTGTGGDPILVGSSSSSGAGGGNQCATGMATASLLPLNMFIAVDRSGSMSGQKWNDAKSAFTTFFADPAAAPLRVALRFWPDDQPFGDQTIHCNDDVDFNCGAGVVNACSTPQVPLGPLSDPLQVQSLVDIFNNTQPSGLTPMSAALQGATKFMGTYVIAKNHTEQGIVILVTDGEPSTCNTDVNFIANVANTAYQGAGVLTFVVGMQGANQVSLDTIAAGGHTAPAFMISGANAAQQLLATLQAIQAASIACSFDMPDAPPGKKIDPTQVEVKYTPSMGGMPVTIPKVPSAAQCGANGGWYYDNEQAPTKINLCPGTCQQIQLDNGASIEIALGCIIDIG